MFQPREMHHWLTRFLAGCLPLIHSPVCLLPSMSSPLGLGLVHHTTGARQTGGSHQVKVYLTRRLATFRDGPHHQGLATPTIWKWGQRSVNGRKRFLGKTNSYKITYKYWLGLRVTLIILAPRDKMLPKAKLRAIFLSQGGCLQINISEAINWSNGNIL